MTVTLAGHEIISWALTLASTILCVVERRKNDTTKYYMVLQGILCGSPGDTTQHLRNTHRAGQEEEHGA